MFQRLERIRVIMKFNSQICTTRSQSERLLETIRNRGGVVINKGEEGTIVQSYRGYGVRTDDHREINRIEHWKVEFIEQ
jgi:hypothetical protein